MEQLAAEIGLTQRREIYLAAAQRLISLARLEESLVKSERRTWTGEDR